MDRLLFVDDDAELLDLNYTYFTAHGFAADTASCAKDAMALLKETKYDCIILDIRMDGQDGFELCAALRARSDAPVIFLTVLTDGTSLERGFQSGGDDYMVKPYSMKELELRIRARMHPHLPLGSGDGTDGGGTTSRLRIRSDQMQAYIGNESLDLTVNEFQILEFLSEHKGVPFRQEEIYKALWGENYNTHSTQVLITRIRRKIKTLSPEKEYIRTQWGKGYVFTE